MRSALWLLVFASLPGCFAPVQWTGPAREPPRTHYDGPHGVPLAYGGGVCPLETVHSHGYPPVPAAAFTETSRGVRDTRTLHPFYDAHPLNGRTCFREGLHLHLEPPAEGVRFEPSRDAWVARPKAAPKKNAAP